MNQQILMASPSDLGSGRKVSPIGMPRHDVLFLAAGAAAAVVVTLAVRRQQQKKKRTKVLVIGGAGAIGKRLIAELVKRNGPGSVIAGLRNTPLPPPLDSQVICEYGVDVRKEETLAKLFAKHGDSVEVVWNLAAPLSVDTAADPKAAHDTVVGGMEKILRCMASAGVRRICFSDSIGSFGSEAPRAAASASWLVRNPTQDPGSDYGRQKRACRELMAAFSKSHGFDTRWCVIPGVLHSDETWGGGTTEYALDAILSASRGGSTGGGSTGGGSSITPFGCIVPLDAQLPMILADDLIEGMLRLMSAPRAQLTQPEAGYALAGFSFSGNQLCALLQKRCPGFTAVEALDPAAAAFAGLWPDSLSGVEAKVDLGFEAGNGFEATVDRILQAHRTRAGR